MIDGKSAASIGAGQSVEIDLTPGRHLVSGRISFMGSQPIEIDADPGNVRSLAVNYDPRNKWIVSLSLIVPWLILIAVPLSEILRRGPGAADEMGWWLNLWLPFTWLPMSFNLLFLRNYRLILGEIPGPDLTDRQAAKFLGSRPLRFRVTVRQSLIAVALLAIHLGIAIHLTRSERSGHFGIRAKIHASYEESWRELERSNVQFAVDWEKRGLDGTFFRKHATGYAAKADYRGAMRRKYEEAVARHLFFVKPDPPEPP